MTVALDSFGTPASSTGNFSFVHTPVGTVKGVVIAIIQNVGSTDELTGVSYGGVSLQRVGAVFHTTGETGVAYLYHLGSNIPTGPQTVSVTVNGTGSNKRVNVWALTAAAGKDTAVQAFDVSTNADAVANPSVVLSLGGKTCWCGISFFSGVDLAANVTPLASWTATLTQQWAGNIQTGGAFRYNTIAAVDVTAGWTQAADDAAMVAVAITEATLTKVQARKGLTRHDA